MTDDPTRATAATEPDDGRVAWGLSLSARIYENQRDAIERAIERLICPGPDDPKHECHLTSMGSMTGTEEQVTAWMLFCGRCGADPDV